jgi:hypothetical protein
MAQSKIEHTDDIERRGAEFVERYNNRLAVDGKAFFIKHYINIKACLGLRFVSGEFKQFGFVFQALPSGEKGFDWFVRDNSCHNWLGVYNDQPFMLSRNVELMEGPQRVVPSIVRAERFEDIEVVYRQPSLRFARGQPCFSFYSMQGISEFIEAAEKREVCIRAGRHAIAISQGSGKEIKRTSEGIDDGTDAGIDDGWQWRLFTKYSNFLSGLRINLYKLYPNIRVSPSVKPINEEWQLGFAPVDRPYTQVGHTHKLD